MKNLLIQLTNKVVAQKTRIDALEKIITDQDARIDKLEEFFKWIESQNP